MEFVIDLDPRHRVLRITIATVLTDEACTDIYRAVKRFASCGSPYTAVITDLSQVVDFPISSDTVRALAATGPAVPAVGPRVMVVGQPALYGLARMFELYQESMGGQLQLIIVRSMDEAYDLLKVTPQDFSQHLYPENVAA
jgi:hypothetical protein